jgi:hypothetical protein
LTGLSGVLEALDLINFDKLRDVLVIVIEAGKALSVESSIEF